MQTIKALSILVLITILQNSIFAQNIPSWYNQSVVYIYTSDGNEQLKPNATGFLVGITPYDTSDSLRYTFGWQYLVTNKHIIFDSTTRQLYKKISARINLIAGGVDTISLPLKCTGKDKNVFVHPDSSVDLVIIPINVTPKTFECVFLKSSLLFKSKQELDSSFVYVGTNIFYTGMFSPYLGYKHNYPIVRFGKVSLMTDEKISWTNDPMPVTLILAETTTFGGNSGSPAFAYPWEIFAGALGSKTYVSDVKLLGVIKGYFGETKAIEFIQTSSMTPASKVNFGITGIIPSYFIYEILNSKELTNLRKQYKIK